MSTEAKFGFVCFANLGPFSACMRSYDDAIMRGQAYLRFVTLRLLFINETGCCFDEKLFFDRVSFVVRLVTNDDFCGLYRLFDFTYRLLS